MNLLRTPLALLIACACCACSSGSSTTGTSAAASSNADGAAGAAGAGDVGCTNEAGLDSYAPGLHKLGSAGQYDFKLLSSTPAPPALDDNTFVVQVSDASGHALDGQLGVALDMPEHGHSSPVEPNIVYVESQKAFTLKPMDLFMVGLWRFTFSFSPSVNDGSAGAAGSGAAPSEQPADSAVFEFCVE